MIDFSLKKLHFVLIFKALVSGSADHINAFPHYFEQRLLESAFSIQKHHFEKLVHVLIVVVVRNLLKHFMVLLWQMTDQFLLNIFIFKVLLTLLVVQIAQLVLPSVFQPPINFKYVAIFQTYVFYVASFC